MIEKKGEFYGGVGLLAVFALVLLVIFMPVFRGHNGLDYLDALYNSISKGSAYYIPAMQKEAEKVNGKAVRFALTGDNEKQAKQMGALFNAGGALVNVKGVEVTVDGDLGKILANCLVDADKMYHNHDDTLASKYGFEGRLALFTWWNALKSMDKELKKQKKFEEAKVSATIMKKAVETSYNYFGIEPQHIKDKYGIVIFSLVFYVIYTLWYGFAILFMFEGWGLKLAH